MEATKYGDLVVLLILLDEVQLRSRDAADLCDLAITLEETEN